VTGLLQPLLVLNLALAAAILAVAASRAAMRKAFGAQAAYAVWAAVPAAALAGLLPRPSEGLPLVRFDGEGALAAVGQATSSAGPDLGMTLVLLWLGGALAMAVVLGWRQAAYLSWLGDLEPADGDRRRFTARRAGAGPLVIGLLNPRIVTGRDFDETYLPHERALILAHEQAHLRRGDASVNALAAAARCVFWFNPLVHWAAVLVREDQELACDAAVLRRFPGQRKAYGELLLKTQLAGRPAPIGCQWPAQAGRLLKERIVMLKAPRASQARTTLGFTAAGLLTLAIGASAWAAEQRAGLSGVWTFDGTIIAGQQEAVAKPTCTFKQTGETLTGTCQGPGSEGPVTGEIKGEKVTWRWTHKPRNATGAPAGVSTFDGVIGADHAMHGKWSYSGMPGLTGDFSGQRQ
jgi:beta-lactamase regulating signal transducer with metallopeptidase domain